MSYTLFLCLTLLVAFGEAKPSCDVDLVDSTGDLHMLQANAKKVLPRRTGSSKTFSGDLTRILQLNEMASSSAMSIAAQLANAKTTEKKLVPDTAPHGTEIVKLLQIQQGGEILENSGSASEDEEHVDVVPNSDTGLRNATFELDDRHFCIRHQTCELKCQQACSSTPQTPHFVYMHIQKTGGSSIECAWQEANGHGLVDLLGHCPKETLDACTSRCAKLGVPSRKVLTVRNPYSYWESVYKYAWQCMFNACKSEEKYILLEDPASGVSNVTSDAQPSGRIGVLQSFETFLEYAATSDMMKIIYQSDRIRRLCGEPCEFDELLRTESLNADWQALLHKYPGLPQVALPVINEAEAIEAFHPWGQPPSVTYTSRLEQLVQEMDSSVFDAFNYSRVYTPPS